MEELLYNIFTENTGKSFLDSGDAYGRRWERNQSLTVEDFKAVPSIKFTVEEDCIIPSISTFHSILDNCEVDWICQSFNNEKFYLGCDREDELKEWIEQAFNRQEMFISDVCNTYNYDNDLDYTIQYFTITDSREYCDEHYTAISVHLGCDVRGGYTQYYLFKSMSQYGYDSYAGYLPFDTSACDRCEVDEQLQYRDVYFDDILLEGKNKELYLSFLEQDKKTSYQRFKNYLDREDGWENIEEEYYNNITVNNKNQLKLW